MDNESKHHGSGNSTAGTNLNVPVQVGASAIDSPDSLSTDTNEGTVAAHGDAARPIPSASSEDAVERDAGDLSAAIGRADSGGADCDGEETVHGGNVATPATLGNPEGGVLSAETPAAMATTALVLAPAVGQTSLVAQAEVHPRGSIGRALDDVQAYEASLETVAVVARSLAVTDTELVAGDVSYTVSKRTFPTFCEIVKAPSSYVRKLPPRLQRAVLEHHQTLSFGEGERVYLLARDGEFIGLRDPKLLALPARDVLCAAGEALGDAPFQVAGLRWATPTTIEFELVMPSVAAEVVVGDVVQAGVRIAHSVVGAHATWVSSYVLRLLCSNGLTARQCVSVGDASGQRQLGPRTRRLPANLPHARESQLEQVRRLVAREAGGLDARLAGLTQLTTGRVNVEALFAGFLQRAHLPQTLLPILRAAWAEEGGASTRWGAVNAFTRVATHNRALSPRVLRALAALGGLVAFESRHICPSCFRHIAGPVAANEDDEQHDHGS